MTEVPEPIDPRAAMAARPHVDPRMAVASEALDAVDDPVALARLAAAACARIEYTSGPEQLRVLTDLVHTVRALADAAERAAGGTDPEVTKAMWRLTAAIGSRLTEQPLPVLRGFPHTEEWLS